MYDLDIVVVKKKVSRIELVMATKGGTMLTALFRPCVRQCVCVSQAQTCVQHWNNCSRQTELQGPLRAFWRALAATDE